MMLICVSVTDVELQEFYLASSPPPDSFLLVKYTHTVHHFTPLHTITVHFHTTIFDSTQFYTKYIYLQWHFTALSTMHLFTPLNVITVT